MKKRTKRLLATLLASVMILQQGSTVGVLATEETGELPAETIVTEAPAPETQAPEVQAPAPETQASETQAPETKAPETQAPETKAPETQAPETKAPEMQAPETPAPETQAPEPVTEAKAPAQETPETAAATENATEKLTETETQTSGTEKTAGTQSETPDAPTVEAGTDVTVETVAEAVIESEESEAETEAPKTDFIYEDARVKITATAQPEANLPQDAQIHADYIQPGTPEYQAAAAALEAAYAGQDVVLDYVFYDIYFTAASAGDGRIEPEAGTVTVSMQFKQPELKPEAEAAQAADEAAAVATTYDVMHVENGKAQEVPSNVQTTEDGSVVSVSFTSDSFSPYAVVMLVEEQDEVATIAADEPVAIGEGTWKTEEEDLAPYIYDMDIKYNGVEVDEKSQITDPATKFEFDIKFQEPTSATAEQKFSKNMCFKMPNSLVIPDENKEGDLKDTSNPDKVVGHYKIDDEGKVHITFTDEFMQENQSGRASGSFHFSAQLSEEAVENGGKVLIPDTTIEKTVGFYREGGLNNPKKEASYNVDTKEITYNIYLNNYGVIKDIEITDILGSNLELKPDADGRYYYDLTIGSTTTRCEFVKGSGDNQWTIKVDETIDNVDYQHGVTITYKAEFKDGVLGNLYDEDFDFDTVKNKASIKGKNGKDEKLENEVEANVGDTIKEYKWFNKNDVSAVIPQEEGAKKYFDWSFEYNISRAKSVWNNTVQDTVNPPVDGLVYYQSGDKIHVVRDDGVTFDIDVPEDGLTWSYMIGTNPADTYGESHSEAHSYTFKYKTYIKDDILNTLFGKQSVVNTVGDGEHSDSGKGIVEGGIPKPTKDPVEDSISVDSVKWKVTIQVPETGMDFYFSDDTYGQTTDARNIIRDSISVEGLSPDTYIVQKDPWNPTDYFFFGSQVSQEKNVDDNKKVSHINGPKRTITFYYETKVKDEGTFAEGETLTNTINWDDGSAKGEADIPGRIAVEKAKVDGYWVNDKNYTNDGRKYSFAVAIDTKRMGMDGNVVVKDTHSPQMSYVPGSAYLLYTKDQWQTGADESIGGKWVEIEDSQITTSTSASGKQSVLTFNLGLLTDLSTEDPPKPFVYRLFYQMEVAEGVITSSDGVNLTNQAKVDVGDQEDFGVSNVVSVNYKNPLFNKEEIVDPESNKEYKGRYKITVAYVTDYAQEDGTFKIQDEYKNLLLDFESLKITKNDSEIPAGSYIVIPNSSGMEITIKEPVNLARYEITYDAIVLGSPGDTVTYSNTAYVVGQDDYYSKVEDGLEKKQESSGSVGHESFSLRIFKYGNDNAALGLEGATFDLLDASGKVLKSGITTNANGTSDTIKLNMDDDGTYFEPYILYQLEETAAPEGFALLEEPIKFYFTNDSLSADDIPETLKDAIAIYEGQTLNISNEKGKTDVTFSGKKTITGLDRTSTTFVFDLYETDSTFDVSESLSPKESVSTKGEEITKEDGIEFSFSKIEYSKAKTYYYVVKERAVDANSGFTTDTVQYHITVAVNEDGTGGLTKNVTVKKIRGEEQTDATIGTLDFVNAYVKEAVAQLKVQKTYTGSTSFPEGGFMFTLTAKGNTAGISTPMPASVSDTRKTLTVTDGNVKSFGSITYTTNGTYYYEISEVKGTLGGVTYDDTVYEVQVNVAGAEGDEKTVTVKSRKKASEGESEAEYTGSGTTFTATFKNSYAEEGTAEFKVKKSYNVTPYPTGDSAFEFILTAVRNTAGVTTPMPSGGTGTTKTLTVTDDEEQSFGSVTYTENGMYYYTISETEGDVDGVVYDKTVYEIQVEVADGSNGQKTVIVKGRKKVTEGESGTYNGSGVTFTAEFNNVYKETHASGKLELNVTKSMKNPASTKNLSMFAFTLRQTSPASTPEYETTKNADKDGNVKFELSYGEADKGKTFVYEITEQPGSDATVIYDPAVYTVTVKVADKADAKGVLAAEIQSVTKKVKETTTDLGTKGAVTFVNDETIVKISKVDATTQEELKGAHIQILDEEGNIVEEWNSTEEPHEVKSLKTGKKYTLRETVAPDGYEVTSDTTFELKADGTIDDSKTTTTVKDGVLLVEDSMTSVKISKVDVTNSEELAGAHIQILDKDNKVVAEWNSTTAPHEVKGLKTGETYTLRETVAPNGYTVTTDTTFVLKEDGTIDGSKTTTKTDKAGVLLVEDSLNEISIQKVDETGAAVRGAKLVIKDAEDRIVESWTTDGKAHDLSGYGKGKYTLSEVEAPEGYQVAEDVPFEVTGTEKAGTVISLTMTDTKKPVNANRSLRVTKHLRLDGISSDVGVHEAVYYVALYSDAAREHRVSNVKKIEFRDSTTSSVLFNNLGLGTYYVGETDENGTKLVSKKVNDRLVFYPEYGAEAAFTFEGSTTEGVAEFTNVYVELPAGFYLSGRLTVTKRFLVGGVAAASNDTYYARVFSDKALTKPASDVLALSLGGSSSASITVTDLPIGETLDSSATYYVVETDVNGTPLDPAAVTGYKISIDKSEVVLNNSNWNQEVVITNDYAAAEEEHESESEFETEYESESEFESETEVEETKTAPKTGDDTDYMRYLLLMALSAGTCAVAFGQKRRKKRAGR